MKIGVPDEILHGGADNYIPDWAPSLEERFHNTVKVRERDQLLCKHRVRFVFLFA